MSRLPVIGLALAVVLLFLGLAAWAFIDRHRALPDAELLAAATEPQPPIGTPMPAEDPRAHAIAIALGDITHHPVVLFRRGDTDVIGIAVPGSVALDAMARLEATPALGVPVLLGPGRSATVLAAAAPLTSTPVDATLRRAAAMDAGPLIAPGPTRPTIDVPLAALHEPALRLPWPEIAIGLFPSAEHRSSDALAWLAFGNWRGCPEAAEHIAMVRRLEAAVGARLRAVTDETIELEVTSVPDDPAAREALATALSAYAPTLGSRADGTARDARSIADEVLVERYWTLRWRR